MHIYKREWRKDMTKLSHSLTKIKQKPIGLMTHVVIGYPTLRDTQTLVTTMSEMGVDVIELQIPFSDPLADGPTIMRACENALENNTKVSDAFTLMKALTKQIHTPLLFMCYYNTIFHFGTEKFIRLARESGCEGLLVPDIPLEEEKNEHFYASCKQYGIPVIFVVSPATTDARLAFLSKHANGFVYATARQGTTGSKSTLAKDTTYFLHRVKKYFSIPVAVGFGISKRDHIHALRGNADIAVVGSALIDYLHSSKNLKKGVSDFIDSLMIE